MAEEVADEYDMADESKALRVLLDYAVQDVSKDLIFSDENMRCPLLRMTRGRRS